MLRVFTAFSGYDSQCLALRQAGVKFNLVGWSEIDKYAIQAHNALFPKWKNRNYGDISKIDWEKVPDFDLFTYSSPCQDFSQAGKQAGGTKGSGTRSSLLWECERAIIAKRPKYLLMENVAALVSSKFIKLFNEWQLTLERYGYTNFAQVLNAKTHGYPAPVPQNRERIFMVSILDCSDQFCFPEAQKLKIRLKDILEQNVDEKYYLSDSRIAGMIESTERERELTDSPSLLSPETVSQMQSIQSPDPERLITILGWSRDSKGNITNYHPVKVANAVTAAKRANTQNYIVE